MVGKNNIQEKFNRRANKNKRYTLKKLSVGVASVALGTVLLLNNVETVSADTEDDAVRQAEAIIDQVEPAAKEIESLLDQANAEGRSLTPEERQKVSAVAPQLLKAVEDLEEIQGSLPEEVVNEVEADIAPEMEDVEQGIQEQEADAAQKQAEKAADEGFEIGKRIEALLAKENKTAEDKKEIAKLAQELVAKGETIEGLQAQLPDDIQAQIDEDLATVEEETEQNLEAADNYEYAKQLAEEGFKIGKQIEALLNKESLTPDEKMKLENLKEELKKKGKEIENINHLLPQHIQKQIEEDLAAAEAEKETESTPLEERTFENVRKELFELISQRHEIYNKLGTDDNGQKVTTPAEYAEMKKIVDAIKQTFDELDRIAQTDSELKGRVKSLKGAVIQGETSIPPLKQEPKDQENQEDQGTTAPSQSENKVAEITQQADQIMSEIDQLFDGVAQDEEGNPILTAKDNATYEELIKKLEREISTIEPQLANLSEANKESATEKLNKYKEEIKEASFSFKVNNVQNRLAELEKFYDGFSQEGELTPADLHKLEMHINALEKAIAEIEAELSAVDEVRQAHLNALINNAKEEINVGRLQLRSAKIIDAVEEKWTKVDELYKSLQDIDNENYNATFTPDQLEQLKTLISDLGAELTKAEEAIKELPETYKQVIEAELAPYKAELLAGKNQLDYVNTIKQAEDIMASIEALFENLSVVDGEPVVSAEEQATFAKLIDELSDEIKKIEAELPTFSEEVAENVRQKLATYKQEIKDAQEQLKAVPFTAKPTENLYNKQYEKGEVPSEVDLMEIDFEVEEREDNTLPKGERKVIQRGVIGLKKVTKFFFPDVDEPVKHEEILKESTKEIVLVGIKESESQDDVKKPSDIYFTEIPYKVEEREDNTLNKGERKVIQPGVKGLKKVTEFNQPGAGEPEKHEKIIKQPTNEIVLVGTKEVTPPEKKNDFDAQLHKNLVQTELGVNRNDSIANSVQSDIATRDDFKAEFLAAYKERTIEELKAKGVTNKFVFNIIQRANTIEGIDSVVAELNSSVKDKEKDKTPEKGNGNQAPDQGKPTPENGTQTPDQGKPIPENGTQTPDQGKPTPDQGKPAPDKGQETPDKGQQAPQSAKGLSTTAEAKPAFPQAELDKLVAEERAKREAGIQTLPNLTQAQKDQFVANLKKASTVDEFDAILGEAKALTATQPEKAEQSEKQVDKKQEEKKADQKQGERLPDTATGAWALGLVGVSSILAGAGIKKIKA